MRPLGNRVIIAPLPVAQASAWGILLPANYQDGSSTGQFKVLAVGPSVSDIAPGDHVLVDLQGDHVTLEDGTRIVRENQCLMSWT